MAPDGPADGDHRDVISLPRRRFCSVYGDFTGLCTGGVFQFSALSSWFKISGIMMGFSLMITGRPGCVLHIVLLLSHWSLISYNFVYGPNLSVFRIKLFSPQNVVNF